MTIVGNEFVTVIVGKIVAQIGDLVHLVERVGRVGIGGEDVGHGAALTLPSAEAMTLVSRSLTLPWLEHSTVTPFSLPVVALNSSTSALNDSSCSPL